MLRATDANEPTTREDFLQFEKNLGKKLITGNKYYD